MIKEINYTNNYIDQVQYIILYYRNVITRLQWIS